MRPSAVWLTLPLLVIGAAIPLAHGQSPAGDGEEPAILIESLEGPLTETEIDSFKAFMRTVSIPSSNQGNAMVYGSGGGAVEALGAMYEISRDREVLDLMVRFCDHFLAARNDPETGRMIWTGRRELCWPNKKETDEDAAYSGTENGDVIAHIAYAAKLILEDESLHDQTVGLGDPFGYGATYRARAMHYVRACDETIDTFILPHFVNPETNRYHFPDSDGYGALGPRYERARGGGVPWNQQMMLNGGIQRLAECHALLGDDPPRVARYDAIVQASLDWFLSELVSYDVDGNICYKWSYATGDTNLRYIEDTGHAGYDIFIVRAYLSRRYDLDVQALLPFANTVKHVIHKGDNTFAWRVDGSDAKGTRNYLPPTFLYLAEIDAELYPLIAEANLDRARRNPITVARIFWGRHNRQNAATAADEERGERTNE